MESPQGEPQSLRDRADIRTPRLEGRVSVLSTVENMFSLVQKSESPNEQEPKIAIVGISPLSCCLPRSHLFCPGAKFGCKMRDLLYPSTTRPASWTCDGLATVADSRICGKDSLKKG